MKKLILVAVLALIANMGFSQTEKGKWIVAGTSNLSFQSQKFSMDDYDSEKTDMLTLQVGAGNFVFDNFALIGSLNYSKQEQGEAEISSFTLMASARYYIDLGKTTKLYGEAGLGNMSLEIGDESESGFAYGLGTGLAIFINETISFDLGLNYTKASIEDLDIKNTGINIGLSIYF